MNINQNPIIKTFTDTIPKIEVTDGVEVDTLNKYDFIDGVWISSIAVFNTALVLNSNHFINLILQSKNISQETGDFNDIRKPTYIYSRIIKNYNDIINNKNTSEIIPIEDRCIFLHNSFSSGNAGHDLFIILDVLRKYKDDSTIKFVLFDEIKYNNNIFIINLFIDESRIIRIKKDNIYNFKRLIFNFEKDCHDAKHYIDIFNEIKQKIKEKAYIELSKEDRLNLENKKIIIIKNTEMNKIVRREDCFNAEILFDYLRKNGWYICNPETDDYLKMAYIFLNASIIITADRGISCANQFLYNLDAKIIGFQINKKKFILTDNIKFTKYDLMCNSLYHHLIKKIILSPLDIKKEHLSQIEVVINLL
jgi:hypothetical protein